MSIIWYIFIAYQLGKIEEFIDNILEKKGVSGLRNVFICVAYYVVCFLSLLALYSVIGVK